MKYKHTEFWSNSYSEGWCKNPILDVKINEELKGGKVVVECIRGKHKGQLFETYKSNLIDSIKD